MTEMREYDVGVEFLTTLVDVNAAAIDVSSASVVQFRFRKPSGTEATKTGALKTTGTDGKVTYTTVANDLDEVGVWQYQVRVVYDGGELTSAATRFRVEDAIGLP